MEEEKNETADSGYWSGKSGLENLLRDNLKYSQEILANTKKIKRHLLIRTVFNVIWLVLVLAPLIVAIIWLPQALEEVVGPIKEVTGDAQSALDLLQQLKQLQQ